jgi:hypothetical protein
VSVAVIPEVLTGVLEVMVTENARAAPIKNNGRIRQEARSHLWSGVLLRNVACWVFALVEFLTAVSPLAAF